LLAGNAGWRLARRQNTQVVNVPEQPLDRLAKIRDLLAVVEHQHDPAAPQRRKHLVLVSRGHIGDQSKCLPDRRPHHVGMLHRRKLDEGHLAVQRINDAERQSRLANTRRAGDRHHAETGRLQDAAQRLKLAITPDDRREHDRQRRWWPCETRFCAHGGHSPLSGDAPGSYWTYLSADPIALFWRCYTTSTSQGRFGHRESAFGHPGKRVS